MRAKLLVLAALLFGSVAWADDSLIIMHNQPVGIGEQHLGDTVARVVHPDYGLYHAPSYLPFYPTAAPIWPSIIEVSCIKKGGNLICDNVIWSPSMGRGEYVYLKPVLKEEPRVVEVTVIKEVPVKKKRE